jgi:hypothetical protein
VDEVQGSRHGDDGLLAGDGHDSPFEFAGMLLLTGGRVTPQPDAKGRLEAGTA